MKVLLQIIFIALLFAATNIQAQQKAITGGTLVNSKGDEPIENAVILIDSNKIIKIGKSKEVKIPENAEIIDAAGKWIIPGLIDSHVHFFQSGGLYTRPDVIDLRKHVPYIVKELAQIKERLPDTFARYLRCGVTSVADVGGPFWNFEVRKLAQETSIAPRIAVAGPLISTYQPEALTTDDPPIIKVNTPEEARELVRRQAEKNADLIKIWYIVRRGETPEEHLPIIEATMDESKKHGLRVAVHATQLATAKAAVRAGAKVLVHSVTDKPVDDEFIDLLKDNGVIYTTTLTVFEGYPEVLTQQVKLTPAEHEMANPYIVSTFFDLRELPEEDIPERRLQAIKNPQPIPRDTVAIRNAKILQDAGVMLAAGTDAGNIGTLHGPAVFREYELLAEAGLTPVQILVAATLNGARVMGRENELGTIEAGKLADMVILNADPLKDIRNTGDIFKVIKNGEVYAPGQLVEKSAADLVQQQVNAYNARDLEAFLATYSPEIELFNQPNERILAGLEEMRERYRSRFESSPALHAAITNRIALGNYVIDRERVSGLPNGTVIDAVAIYEVRDGLIRRVWFVRE